MTRYVDFRTRHGIPLVTVPVADVSDETAFPEIAAAVAWARKQRASND